MADQEEEDLQMALRMSMQSSPPEPKRSKPIDTAAALPEESRRRQRELMAIAAEKRMMAGKFASPSDEKLLESEEGVLGRELSTEEANELFLVVFGNSVSKDILAQWCNQGIRFSPDPETCIGLVQHEGGPCGVLATIQAFVLKYLLFSPDGSGQAVSNMLQNLASERISKSNCLEHENLGSLDEGTKTRALIKSLSEILLLCGSNRRVVIATLKTIGHNTVGSEMDETVVKALEGLSIESGSDLKELLRVEAYTSQDIAMQKLQTMMPVFQSSMGALLFLISALLSRGLDNVQADRDDPSFPLVTAPFGHASQEIVNLLLCGQAVANVFDGSIDLGGGMFLKGIPSNVEVGFLTLLESLNFCKVGQHLKRPNWPIWVVGSESHYTVLFALKTSVQDENEAEERESQIRRAFDAQDQSGGGGFISVEGFHQVLREVNVELPPEKLDHLCSTGFIVWSDFWRAILDLEKSLGGLKHTSGLMGKKVFDLYHFNGIAKSNINGLNIAGETPVQKPRLTKLRVSVPPQWTPEEYMANESSSKGTEEATSSEPSQHAPLVDCIRTRWPRASCSWVGDPPSIV